MSYNTSLCVTAQFIPNQTKMNDPIPTPILILIITGFPLVFGTFWTFVSLLLSVLGGWRRLASHYRTDQRSAAPALHPYWLMMGPVSYRGITTLQPTPEGLWISVMILFRLGHPPLLIPWRDVRGGHAGRPALFNTIALELGNPRITTLRLSNSAKVQAMLAEYLPSLSG